MELFTLLACINLMFALITANQLITNSPSLKQDWDRSSALEHLGIIIGLFFLWWAVVAWGKDFHE